jgi:hypothetical protein
VGFVAELGGEFSTLVASKPRVRSERDDLIAALYEEGLPVAAIAERAGTKGIWTFTLGYAKAELAAGVLIGASPISMRRKRALLAQIAGRTA